MVALWDEEPDEELEPDSTPRQSPKLTELEAGRAYVQIAHQHAIEWLMTPEMPDVDTLLAQLVNPPAWHARAACRGMGPALFFPATGGSIAPALEYCRRCDVRAECLAAAPSFGVWGGLSAKGRRLLRRGAA